MITSPPSSYGIETIDADTKYQLYADLLKRPLYTRKSDIYGCCIKLLTDNPFFADIWSNNFYTANENTRSHGRLISVEDPSQPMHMKYDPLTKTAFLFNFDYYGWVKSVALAVAGDILEDAHDIYSVHGAVLDVGGSGVALIAPSGTGKTTHSWGMLRNPSVRLVADDWFFVRVYENSALAYGSEKNGYVDEDLGKIWGEYRDALKGALFDRRGRAVINIRWVVSTDRVIPLTTMKKVVLMKRDRTDPEIIREIGKDEALDLLVRNRFYNPHQLVEDRRKTALRTQFFRSLLDKTRTYVANTAQAPETVQDRIYRAVAL